MILSTLFPFEGGGILRIAIDSVESNDRYFLREVPSALHFESTFDMGTPKSEEDHDKTLAHRHQGIDERGYEKGCEKGFQQCIPQTACDRKVDFRIKVGLPWMSFSCGRCHGGRNSEVARLDRRIPLPSFWPCQDEPFSDCSIWVADDSMLRNLLEIGQQGL